MPDEPYISLKKFKDSYGWTICIMGEVNSSLINKLKEADNEMIITFPDKKKKKGKK